MDMPVYSRWVIDGATKMIHMVRKVRKTQRGLTYFIRPTPAKRPIAKPA